MDGASVEEPEKEDRPQPVLAGGGVRGPCGAAALVARVPWSPAASAIVQCRGPA